MNKSALQPGAILNSRYTVLRVIGVGGFGIVYLCCDNSTGKEVAVKELYREKLCSRQPDGTVQCHNAEAASEFSRLKDKFSREASLLLGLDHPGIVHVTDSFCTNNTCYYVMDYIEGTSMEKMTDGRPLSEDNAFGIIRQIASALQYLHSRNILHLDLKPANIIISPDGHATIIDFGEATDISGTQNKKNDGVAISSGFAALEQYRPDSSLSGAADIYALGATYYTMLTGKVPPVATELVSRAMSSRIVEEMSQRAKWAITQAMQTEASGRPDADRFLKMADRSIPMEDLVESLDDETASEKLKSFTNDFSTKSKSAWRNYPMTVVSAGILVLLLLVTVGVRQGWLVPDSDSVLTPAAIMDNDRLLPEDDCHASELRELIHKTNTRSGTKFSPTTRLRVNGDTLTLSIYLTKKSSATFNSLRSAPTSAIARNLAATSDLYSDIMNLTRDNGLKLRTEYIYIPDGTKITTNQPWAPLDPSDEQAFKDFHANFLAYRNIRHGSRLALVEPMPFDGKNLYYFTENMTQFNELSLFPAIAMSDSHYRNISGVNRIIEKNKLRLILEHGEDRNQRISRPIPFELNYQ
ncbi:MAG: serine/threonine protein kinase [Muribaculaceae bacterium]|nr:serine/threonine protein kinase [Muribaculaceae bacterium]